MSYDLYLKPRSGRFDLDAVRGHFVDRPNYTLSGTQIFYSNESTGVYFSFELAELTEADRPEKSYPLLFNINMYRPSYFILEAEPEVTALVHKFDLIVLDTQFEGMGEGEYSNDGLVRAWNTSNEFGYSAFLSSGGAGEPLSLPSDRLRSAWRWNYSIKSLQKDLGDNDFVPRIMFLKVASQARTMIVWGDGIPTVIPAVECVFVRRQAFAPQKFFVRKPDHCLITHEEAMAVLKRFDTERVANALTPGYMRPPPDVEAFVRGLSPDTTELTIVAPDQVVDRELVKKNRPTSAPA